ncbi:Membrane protein involved in the export of O-antigen and teichoic acid [Prevotella sp. tc2-28]|uniref:hypothetical protein n=1 Tax=Prevotella sp. tc2-28 TaxID=1761888 RepID=UPI00089491A0|nr:hypothetical protein [Prevotella sp. tc2-28]SEA09764.1 Membrane protein involved in the export of O-antigen and teichoic acid [Prevotella sp. tc2-28]
MSDISANNKRIAKNTIALYFRTFITMIVGLYTGRVMLHALGVDNYGINNVVGSIVAMSSLITATMSAAISRYITYALGKGDKDQLKTMFSTSVNAQIVMSIIAIVVLEIGGLWFLNTVAQIPQGREMAAFWVFQCSLISLAIGLVSSPYNALLVAHERMGIYAYTSIAEAMLKLAICFIILAYGGDRLILLAILTVLVGLGMRIFYGWYCGKNFYEAHYSPKIFDKGLLKELTVFSGWNLLNNGAYTFATQGVNMLINVFFGVAYNAARGIANTVNAAVQSFVGNFTMAFSPQITKSYASGDKAYAIHLGNRGTKFSWLLMYIFIVPVCCEADTLLRLWLGKAPEWSALFLRFAMFESLAVCSGQNLFRLIQSDGHVKSYTIHAAITAGFIFPLTWIAYTLGAPVWLSYVIFIIDFVVLNLVRFYDIKKLMQFSIRQHIKEVIIPCVMVSITSFIVPLGICYYINPGIIRFLVNVPICVLWTVVCCILFGLTKNERNFIWDKTKLAIERIRK